MIKKTILPLLLVLFSSTTLFAQYFETSWISNGVKYTGFAVKTGEYEYLFRIKYISKGEDKLASYRAVFKGFTKSDGTKDTYLDGQNGEIIRGPSGTGYSADNWYFKMDWESEDGQVMAYTVDDNKIGGEDITKTMQPALYWIKLQSDALTENYLSDYFNSDDPVYKLITMDKKKEFELTNMKTSVIDLDYIEIGPQKEDIWTVVLGKRSGVNTTQIMKSFKQFPKDWIAKKWSEGYSISHSDYNNKTSEYLMVMSKPTNWGTQSWKRSQTIPLEWISSKKELNYSITDLTFINKEWFVVMNKNTGYADQLHKFATELPEDWMQRNLTKGYRVTSVDFGGQFWGVVLSRGTTYKNQEWKWVKDYPTDFCRAKFDLGWVLTHISYGAGKWFVVMSQDPGITLGEFNYKNGDIPFSWIMERAN
ncbi:DUF7477 domain-containing protein [Aureicoccus marinus]|uniref:DUF7477 domain-containing protein n=1 Tax=Aureicoccus marinus TaxID=754435 RepID=A0A2S7TA96_9FLAO|nr:hypothetical protein [Aureicoccus marinus]PQJ16554.1 hypothetical protein BST99_13240 [Aureicoccus marinus]